MTVDWDSAECPVKLKNCPILESILEFRFEPNLPGEAIFGVIYNELKDNLLKPEKTGLEQLPNNIIENDPLLKYKPLYRAKHKSGIFTLLIGSRVVSLSVTSPYPGWDKLSEEIAELIKTIDGLKIINKYERIGLRYINSFDENVLENTDLSLNLGDETMWKNDVSIRLKLETSPFSSTLLLSNNVKLSEKAKATSVIDIDTYMDLPDKDNLVQLINEAHNYEKKIFFTLLKKDFVKKVLGIKG